MDNHPNVGAPTPIVTSTDVTSAVLSVNPGKTIGQDRVPVYIVKPCADLWAGGFIDIFNLSLL